MSNRINYEKVRPDNIKVMFEMEKLLANNTIDKELQELIKIRVSQINGCAFCLNMHTDDAHKIGVDEKRIYLLNAWDDTDIYSDKEKAALELAEYVTLISERKVPDTLYDKVRAYYSEEEYTDLIFIIGQINTWNRISISMGNKA
ncbi:MULTISPECIES: carboxymuconolactone decarboxylase family protein [Staphylococcus]|uniref:Carboxymuconolactone decarboxylase family protein n=1 Tax=Staphylococcus pettenkoferi TaxID=170573 RepID=A0A2N6QCU3_9STAP|nr:MULTISPECIES: carboxymuconolactone decarboxylase family protein [Staphylococcus]MBX8994305.1 carboxymuconolactone decarboxylase family protein [Staphylococcus pettenkoferi]MCI2792286.1 carboxymuconolactone decarboxylase family protein [Staphylococcus pettenkoferi]MCY1567752.1 carboxymuconolactone decarboxylase family protein [Staphylococcus pettenkoferi]MCY1588666.1 carboxymuconolactone decarboxylase family protein [Staphylococcus pettenkoferi]MCY1604560.1 carboxymuconolactone decarboxylase